MSIQALRERLAALNREGNALLAANGDRVWSKEEQAKFDGLMEEADRAQAQIDRLQAQLDKDREDNFDDVRNKPKGDAPKKNAIMEGFELFLRREARHLSAEEAVKVRNTMSTTTGSEGGFTVQTLVAKTLIDLMKDYGGMRREASQITTDSGADLSYPTSDGTSEVGEWVAQNASAASADVVFGTRALNCFKAGSKIITVPIELLQDTNIDIVGLVLKRMRDRIGRVANVGYSIGSGTGQPFGLTAVAGTGKTGTTGQTTTIIYDDLVDMVDSLDVAYQMGKLCWMMNQTLRKTVRKIKDTSGRPIWTPSYEAGITQGSPDQLLGYDVCMNNDMPTPAANAKSLAFGDLTRYFIRDAMQVQFFRFDDSAYASKGQVGFLAWARTGGNLMDLNSVKLYQHSAT